ncbi:tape measure protein [Liquorilactobacillus mali]|uniref:Tape measure protein N-terminal domain-containing protein n=1 Tax=Liquorilactobacillus mali TaxID=1618 RepID=A0A0R2FZG8_9LACO|nr:tape measure protein [Liquorilactobacillus mali]KRN31637.1 hypothetical protein IV36_GL001761 [Liquorilactobacillus mali]
MSDLKSNVVLNFKSTGEVSLKQSLKEINSVMDAAAKEYKAHISAMKDSASTSERLAAQQQKLQIQLSGADKRVETLTEQFNKMKSSGSATNTELNKMAGDLAKAQSVQSNLKNALSQVNEQLSQEGQHANNAKDKLSTLSSESQQLDAKEQELTSAYKLQQAELGENASKSERLASEQKSLSSILENSKSKVTSLEQALKETKTAYGENSTEASQMATKLNNAKTNVAELETKMGSLGRESKTTGSALGTFKEKLSFGAVAGVAANTVQSVIGGLGELITQGASASDAMQKFDSTMEFAGFGKTAIKSASSSMKKYADDTVYDLDTVANTTAQLAANGVPHYTALTQAAGNLNAVAGGNADTFSSVAMVLTQTAGAGKLTTENWNQLSDAIPGASGKLQEAMKKNGAYTGNFRDAMEKGQITAGEFNKAVMQLGMEDAAKKAAKSTSTFEGAIGNLQANIVTGIQNVINSIGKANLTDLVNTIGGSVVSAFKILVNVLQEVKAHSGAFKAIAVGVGGLVVALKAMSIITGIKNTITEFVAATKLMTIATKAAEIAQAAFNLVLNANPFVLIVSLIAAVAAALVYFFTQTKTGKEIWSNFTNWLKNLWTGLKNWFSQFWTGLKILFDVAVKLIVNSVKEKWNDIKTATTNIWNAIKTAISNVWNAIKTAVSNAINSVKSTVSNVWNGIKSVTSSIWNGIKSVISSVWSAIKAGVSSSINAVKSVITSVWNGIKSVTSSVWNGIKSVISGVWNGIKSIASSSVNGIKSTIASVWNAIRSITSSVWNGIKSAMVSPINAAKSVISGIVSTIKRLFNFHLKFPEVSIPHIKLPHFSLSGSFDPLKGKIPSIGINWYAKGGIFDKPTLFPTAGGFNGLGEAGPEAALPLNAENLAGIGKGIAQQMGNMQQPIYLQVDGKTFAKLTAPYMSGAMGTNVRLNQFGMGGM